MAPIASASSSAAGRYPLVLLATVDKDELLAPWRAAAISRMLYVLALVMLIAIIGAVLVRHLQRGQRMAAALIEKEAHFRLLAEGSSDMVTRIGLDERLRYVSPSANRVVGWRANQLIGTDALAEIYPEDRPHVQAIVDAMKRGDTEEARVTYRNVHRQKSEVWLEIDHARDAQGQRQCRRRGRDLARHHRAEEVGDPARDARDRGQPHRACQPPPFRRAAQGGMGARLSRPLQPRPF